MPPPLRHTPEGTRAFIATRQAALAGLSAALATGLCVLLDTRMSVAALALVYLVAVMAASAVLVRWAGVLTSFLSVSALNYFFVPPRYTFEVDAPEYLLTLAVLLAVSLGINALVASLRQRQALAETQARQAAQLLDLSEQLAACEGALATAQRAAGWLAATLGRPCAVFVRPAPIGPAAPADSAPHATPLPADLQCCGAAAGDTGPAPDFHAPSAAWAMQARRALGRGGADWPDLPLWCAPFGGPQPAGAVQVLLDNETAGVGPQPDADTLRHWQALARQTGLSVERERAATIARTAQDSARSEALRNTLLASLSHDLRTPLAGILGSASALHEQGSVMRPGERERLLSNLENEARDMSLMVDNILQMARLTPASCRLRLQWESLEEIVGVALPRLRRRWPGARLQCRIPKGLPPVQAEAALLVQVLANLVDNAARHGGGQAQILIQAGRARDGVFIAVRDHGPGLPEGDPHTLFDRLRQGLGTGQGEGGAAGLGLSLCDTIVRAHGGHITARRCTPGAEFRIELPAPDIALPDAPAPGEPDHA